MGNSCDNKFVVIAGLDRLDPAIGFRTGREQDHRHGMDAMVNHSVTTVE